ncbi:MAG: DEAD/DEAH box helicase, partial [Pseudomonadota bacterium]
MKKRAVIPPLFQQWFEGKGWKIREYQRAMFRSFVNRQSTLLIAPTGAGKTLSGFLPSLIDLHRNRPKKRVLHTLYISPLKALTYDIQRNLNTPINDMKLDI